MALPKTRRSNAGNRLQALLEDQAPLDAADADFFAEKEDDEDFDIEAEEERLRRLRSKVADAESSSDEADETDAANKKSPLDQSNEDENENDDDSVSNADSNFSDSTDDSDLENDAEPADSGERQLQQEQRQRNRAKKTAERSKMFTIKRRPPPPPEGADLPKPKKKRLFTSADLIQEKGRKSERRSALRNKEHLIEQMKAAEERRAQYVHPAKPRAPKLTQAQRLEEAKKTEIRNLSTLNKFVELEEERKLQQRLAMISRRPKLTHFVRFHSSSFLEPPKMIEMVSEVYPGNALSLPEPYIKPENALPEVNTNPLPATPAGGADDPHKSRSTEASPESVSAPDSGALQPTAEVVKVETTGNDTKHASDPQDFSDSANNHEQNGANSVDRTSNLPDQSPTDVSSVKSEMNTEPNSIGVPSETKTEEEHEPEDLAVVQGPEYLRSYNFLTLHEFPDVSLNKFSIRNIVLGSSANSSQPPLKRMCPFSGQPAKYRDPKTNVAYTSLESCRLIQMAQENQLGWSKELGGVFTLGARPQRPAKGVPEGF